MAAIAVSDLSYAHPGGDLLFAGVSFRLTDGRHAGLVGANGTGKTTIMRIAAGLLDPLDGAVTLDGRTLYMAQDVGTGEGSVRELLLQSAPARIAAAGRAVLAAERELAAGDESAGIRLGEAIGTWSGLGGYELEGSWDAACRRIVGGSLTDVGDRPAVTLSGGERKQLVLEVLFSSDAEILLLDEPDNFLDVPAKIALEERISAVEEDDPADQPRPRPAQRRLRLDRHARGRRLLGPRSLVRDLPGGARAPPRADGRPAAALERRGAPAA